MAEKAPDPTVDEKVNAYLRCVAGCAGQFPGDKDLIKSCVEGCAKVAGVVIAPTPTTPTV